MRLEEKKSKKKKKCKCNWLYCDPNCTINHRIYGFAPFYGKGDGQSDAEITTGTGGSGGSAFPGAGGINSPGVGGGPNTGMGPITMNRDNFSGDSLIEDMQLIANLNEGINAGGK